MRLLVFDLESEMIPYIYAGLPSLLGFPDSFAHASELPVNNKVVDIVAAPIDKAKLASSESLGKILGKLSMVQLDVLSLFVGRRIVSIQYLAQKTFMSAAEIHSNFLNVFDQYGLVSHLSRYSYTSTAWVNALPPYMVAIEAKLTKWQEALDQAVANKVFANISCVVLAKNGRDIPEKVLNRFSDEGIGLLTVDGYGKIEIAVRASQTVSSVTRDHSFQMVRLLRDIQRRDSKSKWHLA